VSKMSSGQQAEMEKPAIFVMPETHLRADSRPVPESLFEESTHDLGSGVMSKEGYTSAESHQREVRHLWKKVWQIACRENEIPNVGDRLAYDVVGQSVMLVRTAPDIIKAYYNTCQHRGTRLLEKCDNVQQMTCPFHSWSWNLDGSLRNVPARWDFPGVSNADLALRQVRCERWNSFVFINFDKDAQPLEQYIGPDLLRHWKAWPRARSRKVYHYGKIIPANWKLALHAFNEIYHTVGAHPQGLLFTGDCNTQYDFFGPHSRFILSLGVPSPYVAESTDPQDTVDSFLTNYAPPDAFPNGFPKVRTFRESREILADIVRGGLNQMTGADFTKKSDAEMLDAIGYNFFPNVIHWGGYGLPVIHRFRPNGHDQRSCLWEIMALAEYPEGAKLERDAQLVMLNRDELFADRPEPELRFIGHVLDQDVHALLLIQQGLESDGFDGPRYANYQERNLRNFEQHLAKLLAKD
jgi:phenylpropionate dioxygenase-like ring-hydroxylating dioxygenase large terminal subunit